MKRKTRMGAAGLIAAVAIGCSFAQERAVLDRFFGASRLRDKTALAEFATVIFEPHEQGIITRFEILSVSARSGASADGTRDTKDVTLKAPVKLPDGQVVEKTLRVTLERRSGRWFVTAFQSSPS